MGTVILIILIIVVFPEIIIIPAMLIFALLTMFLEFVLRLFGKSFDGKIKK